MKKVIIFFTVYLFLLTGCKTVDFEKLQQPELENESQVEYEESEQEHQNTEEKKQLVEELTAHVDMEKKVVVVEKPVYVPKQEATPEIVKGIDAAVATTQNIKEPQQYDYSAMINDYIENQVYMVYTQMGLSTDFYLEPGEQLIGTPAVSDNRFIIGLSYHMEKGLQIQHVLVKPSAAGLNGTLTIYTNRRVYPIVLKSYVNVYTPIVRWKYMDSGMPWNIVGENENAFSLGITKEYVDPKFLSFDYKMSYFKKPVWLPTNVYDDGKKTYVVLPDIVLQREYPVVFENTSDILNYRVDGTVIIIDKLIEKITLRNNTEKVTITKKRG